jgi:hypothetical protein
MSCVKRLTRIESCGLLILGSCVHASLPLLNRCWVQPPEARIKSGSRPLDRLLRADADFFPMSRAVNLATVN